MSDIAPRYRSTPLVMISRPTAGAPTAHLCGPATGTLCGLPSAATNAAFTQADLLLLELMVGGVEPCPVCGDVVRKQLADARAAERPVDPGAA
jgi:hypothetical protein